MKQEEIPFKIGDLVRNKRKKPYPIMRIIEIIPPGYFLCEWYNKKWNKWEKTPFNSTELIKN